MPAKSDYLNGSGARLVKQLFYEYAHVSGNYSLPSYTLAKQDRVVDGKTYVSLYRRYMEIGDVTEAKFVSECLYDWLQWEKLYTHTDFKDIIKEWRRELQANLSSEMVDVLKNDAKDKTSRSSTSSAKYLLDKWGIKVPETRGRKKKVVDTTEDDKALSDNLAKDFSRLGLTAVEKE